MRPRRTRYTYEEVRERFEPKVRRRGVDRCWPWLGAHDAKGYGLYWGGRRCVRAHRMAYQLYRGEIPYDCVVGHLCGNRGCVNHRHLVLKEFCPGIAKDDPLEDRFWDAVIDGPREGCWRWAGKKNAKGYGIILVDDQDRLAHWVAWELECGPIPPGSYVVHICATPDCVKPEHLTLADKAERLSKPKRRRPHMAGGRNPRARLTDDQAEELRQRYANGEGTQEALGHQYGITKSAVCRILAHQRYTGTRRPKKRPDSASAG